MQQIVIVGTGGFGREVHELLEDINCEKPTFNIIGFLDDDPGALNSTVHDLPVLGNTSWLAENAGVAVALGIGNPRIKRKVAARLTQCGAVFPAIIHPDAKLGRRVRVGEGTIVCAGSIITTDIDLHKFVTINIDVTIGHDSVVFDFVTMAPGVHISGNNHIHQGTDIGTGATTIQGIEIGEWSIVGASSAIVRTIPSNVTVVGVPASVIKERAPGWHLG